MRPEKIKFSRKSAKKEEGKPSFPIFFPQEYDVDDPIAAADAAANKIWAAIRASETQKGRVKN